MYSPLIKKSKNSEGGLEKSKNSKSNVETSSSSKSGLETSSSSKNGLVGPRNDSGKSQESLRSLRKVAKELVEKTSVEKKNLASLKRAKMRRFNGCGLSRLLLRVRKTARVRVMDRGSS